MGLTGKQLRWIYTTLVCSTIGDTVVFGFQNCAETTFTEAPISEKIDTVDSSGTVETIQPELDPEQPEVVVDPEDVGVTEIVEPETCVTGKKLGIWLDPLDLGTRYELNYLGEIVAYQGSKSSEDNFDYYSASAHPDVGPQPVPFQANIFFYEGSDGLSLNFFANIDAGGSSLSRYVWDIKTTGNNLKDYVIVSDDPDHRTDINTGEPPELEVYSVDESTGVKRYKGEFEHYNNTDGGVIGPFEGEDFTIRVHVKSNDTEPVYPLDVEKARFFSANGGSFSLSTDQTVFSSFIIGFKEFETCE